MSGQTDHSDGPRLISDIASQLGLGDRSVEPYGWYCGKLEADLHRTFADRPCGKYIGVTAINPTPFGEGKTVVSIGLAMALQRRGHRSLVTLRQPSLAPVFGIKGGGAGGGRASVLPSDQINLHFTGDLHAVAAATNLLAAMTDNHCQRKLSPEFEASNIFWRRAIDISDKGLAQIETGLNNVPQAPRRHTGFDLTAASEVMSILALATSLADLRQRLGRVIVARSTSGDFVNAEQLGAAGAMAALLRNALRPNLVQTSEHTPALIHAGPFANISHGNCSVIADLTALRLAEYVVTESGFGADLGAEKLFDIKCRTSGLRPDAEVLVCTVRSIKYHSGCFDVRAGRALPDALLQEDRDALQSGLPNLIAHIEILRQFGVPVVVAINRFPSDTERELAVLRSAAVAAGADRVAVVDAFSQGSEGTLELADAVTDVCRTPSDFHSLYAPEMPCADKVELVAKNIYGASGVDFLGDTRSRLQEFADRGFNSFPVCIAKTQYSLSHDAKQLGRPVGFRLPVNEVRLAAGAGFILVIAGNMTLMPGLPRTPAARRIDLTDEGRISGL